MTFEEMTFNEKMEHIWEYYKVHMAVTAGVLLLIGSLLNIYLINPAPDIILDVTVRIEGTHFNYDYQEALEQKLYEYVVKYPESQTVSVELLATDENMDANTRMATEAKFMAKAEVQEMDLFVMDEDNFRYMLSEGFFMDLGQLETEFNMTLPEEAKIISTDPATQEERVFVLDVKKLPGLEPLIYNGDGKNYYVGVFIRSMSEVNALTALQKLSEEIIE